MQPGYAWLPARVSQTTLAGVVIPEALHQAIDMHTTLAGRCGVVTDAISSVGRAVALELGREGARLALGYRAYRGADFEAVEQLVHDLVRVGGEAVPMRLPTESVGDLEQAIGHLVEFWSRLDFVVDQTSECTVGRAALPWLVERGRGRIVHITVPCASRLHFTSGELRALAVRGVAINTILLDRSPSLEPIGVQSEQRADVGTMLVSPAPRVPQATPQDVAASTEFFLAQDCCLTGQLLDFGGERPSRVARLRQRTPFTLRRKACSNYRCW
jgi:hypothetical protein